MAQQEDPLDELACRLEQNSAQVSSGVPHAPIAQFLASASKLSTPPEIRARLAETVGQLAKLEAELAQGARAKARLKQTCADSLSALETLQQALRSRSDAVVICAVGMACTPRHDEHRYCAALRFHGSSSIAPFQ